jgi:hypothetical protein
MLERLGKSLMRVFLLATLCCGVTACATTRDYEESLNSWKGNSEASLIKSLGPPADIFNSNGHRFLVYQDSQSTALEPMRNHSSGSHDYSKTLTFLKATLRNGRSRETIAGGSPLGTEA